MGCRVSFSCVFFPFTQTSSSSLPSERESLSSGESPAQTARGCQQSAADSPPALLIPALIMPKLWQPPARRASAQCACAQGQQHLHYQPIAYITVGWGGPSCTPGFTGTSRNPPWERVKERNLFLYNASHACIFSFAASMEGGHSLLTAARSTRT